MKRISTFLHSSFVSAVVLASGAGAQEDAPTPIIEAFTCTYRGNNDVDNLRAVNTRFNAWADRNNVTTYTAFVLTPYAYSADLTADVVWLGAWPTATAMGVNEALWLSQGGDVAAAFDTVVDCDSHSLYAEVVINQPSGPPPESGGVALFQDCSVREGRTVEEAIVANGQWAEYLKSRGGDHFHALLFPLAGLENDADYDFKVVQGFESMQAYGRVTDVVTGGGFRRGEELFGRLTECNSPRVYSLERVRLAAQPPSG